MKKAKMFLAAFAILAIAGGTLAFKSVGDKTLYGAEQSGVTPTVTVDHAVITSPNNGTFVFTTDSPTGLTNDVQVWITVGD